MTTTRIRKHLFFVGKLFGFYVVIDIEAMKPLYQSTGCFSVTLSKGNTEYTVAINENINGF